jgi:hypothetical protein
LPDARVGTIFNDVLENVWEGRVVAYFNVPRGYFKYKNEDNHENLFEFSFGIVSRPLPKMLSFKKLMIYMIFSTHTLRTHY